MATVRSNRDKEDPIVQPTGVLNIVDIDRPSEIVTVPVDRYGNNHPTKAETAVSPPAVSAPQTDRLPPTPPTRPDAWRTLNMSFLTPEPSPARHQVIFELPQAGRISTWYHEVIEAESCLVLVYDTRFTYGTQYLPPDLGETPLVLHLPSRQRQFRVVSMGIHFACGCLDCVVLVRLPDTQDE